MNQITLTTAFENPRNIPGLMQGDAKNAPMQSRPGVQAVDLIGLSWIFTDYNPSCLAYPERRCNVIE